MTKLLTFQNVCVVACCSVPEASKHLEASVKPRDFLFPELFLSWKSLKICQHLLLDIVSTPFYKVNTSLKTVRCRFTGRAHIWSHDSSTKRYILCRCAVKINLNLYRRAFAVALQNQDVLNHRGIEQWMMSGVVGWFISVRSQGVFGASRVQQLSLNWSYATEKCFLCDTFSALSLQVCHCY